MQRVRRTEGMTLVELMIVVALIGVLSAVAIPSFLSYQARARRAEAFANLPAIARLQKTYAATNNRYHHTNLPTPDWVTQLGGDLGTRKMAWDAQAETEWGPLGWKPEGEVFYTYDSNVCCASELCFTAAAYGDVDDDDSHSAVMYVEPAGGVECVSGFFGFGTPTGPTGKILSQVGINASLDQY